MKQPLPPSSLILLVPLSLVLLCCGALFGAVHLDPLAVLETGSREHHIFWNLRVPQALVAFCAGAGLAVCGMVFQAMFLNTLATPFTLGVAGGASWGASMVIFLSGLTSVASGTKVTLGALAGAALATVIVVFFSRTRSGHQRHVMLLAGVAVSFFFSSLLLLTMSLSSMYQTFQITRWLMGGIQVAGYTEVMLMGPVLIGGFLFLIVRAPHLNLLLLGAEAAHVRGLNVNATKMQLFVVVSIMVAAIVSVTGPIGFVGLVVPHVCRIVWGTDHRRLTVASLLVGGSMLVVCDLVSRLILPPSGLPVGVITSLIGAPFFFILLLRQSYRF